MYMAELRVPRDPMYVGLVRLVVAQAARLAGVPQDRVEDVKIAVAEALANGSDRDDELGASPPVEVRFGRGTAGFEVTVRGLSQPPPATADDDVVDPAIDQLDPKLRFTLIEGLTDEFSREQDGDLMRLRFVVGVT
ncbi:MAG: ATP-binding protein [Actinobacteria bacterium]|nr:ATP-binding protein [Actinomycetota bacterium]